VIIRETTLPGAFLIDLERHVDERGFFARTFDPDARSYRVSFARLEQAVPRFHCSWNARAGAGELADAYREYGLTRDQFDHRFTRLARIGELQREGRVGADLRPTKASA